MESRFNLAIKEDTPHEDEIHTDKYGPPSLKALSFGKCQQIFSVLRDPDERVEYSKLVKEQQFLNLVSSGPSMKGIDEPAIGEAKSEPTWEVDLDPNEIMYIDDDDTDTHDQNDGNIEYTVEILNPDVTVQESPPEELIDDCRVLLFKFMPRSWSKDEVREFIIETTSAKHEDILDVLVHNAERYIKKGQYLFEFKTPEICHLVQKEFTLYAKHNNNIMTAELDIGHQKLNHKLKSIHIIPELRPICKSDQIHQQANNDTYGLSLSYLESLGIQPPLSATVFVSNLAVYVDDELVRQVFTIAGQIKFLSFRYVCPANITAEIEYDHPVEAVQAVAMLDKQKLYDRVLSVKLVKSSTQTFKLPRGLETVGRGLGPNGAPLRGVRAMMELQPVKEILQDIKYALRNVQLDPDNNYFDKPVQILKDVDTIRRTPSTNYSNTEQQSTPSTSTAIIEEQSTPSASMAKTEQQNTPSTSMANPEQQNTLSTSIANTKQQNIPAISNVVADPGVLLELTSTLKGLVNVLQTNNNANPNNIQEDAAQKRPNSNPIGPDNDLSQCAENSDPEPAKKTKIKLGQELHDSASTIPVIDPSTSRRPQTSNPNVARYNLQHQRNLARNIILPNPNVPFVPNGQNILRFDMIGSISNQFGFSTGRNGRTVPSRQNMSRFNPNMIQNTGARSISSLVGNLNRNYSNTSGQSAALVNQNIRPSSLNQNIRLSTPNMYQNPEVNRNASQNSSIVTNRDPSHMDQTKSTSNINASNADQNLGRNIHIGNRNVGNNAPNLNQNTPNIPAPPSSPQISNPSTSKSGENTGIITSMVEESQSSTVPQEGRKKKRRHRKKGKKIGVIRNPPIKKSK